ncbi:hypothetical protein SAMN05216391_10963 [Lachnospiraceae bacterium KHCPX20]|nr:hypothetical protein SAMN05216391_10963 [Lachnospiraceae bacterium KHCPX20]
MKVTKQLNPKVLENFRLSGDSQTDIKNRILHIQEDTKKNIQAKKYVVTVNVIGLSITINKNILDLINKVSKYDKNGHPFLYKLTNAELLKAIIQYYLFDNKAITKDNQLDLLDKVKVTCKKNGTDITKMKDDLECLSYWVEEKCQKIIMLYLV